METAFKQTILPYSIRHQSLFESDFGGSKAAGLI